jgi:hypothetical protein
MDDATTPSQAPAPPSEPAKPPAKKKRLSKSGTPAGSKRRPKLKRKAKPRVSTPKKGPPERATDAAAERRQLVRQMLVDGFSEPTIKRRLAKGVDVNKGTGRAERLVRASSRTVSNDLKAIGSEWRKLHDDPEVQERVFGGIMERLSSLSRAAEDKGKFEAAIRAEMCKARLWGLRTPRWADAGKLQEQDEAAARLAASEDADLIAKRAAGLAALTEAELLEREAELHERVTRLRVLEGGKATG